MFLAAPTVNERQQWMLNRRGESGDFDCDGARVG